MKTADRIAYLHHDIDDAIRGRLLCTKVYQSIREIFPLLDDVTTILSMDMIQNSKNQPEIKMSEPIYNAMMELREFMFNTVYLRPTAQKEINKAKHVVTALIKYYLKHPEEIHKHILRYFRNGDWKQQS